MYTLTPEEQSVLIDVWDSRLGHGWWGLQVDEFHATHMEKVSATESLMGKNLITQNMDHSNVFRIKFLRDGYFYLDLKRQTEATEGVAEVIAGLKRLFPKKKGARATVFELARESNLSADRALKALQVLREFGLPISADLDHPAESVECYLIPSVQVAKVLSFKDMYEAGIKEHENRIAQYERMKNGEPLFPLAVGQPTKKVRPMPPMELFEGVVRNPSIREASLGLYRDGHYAQAIFEAFKMVNILVKKKVGHPDLDGQSLMGHAFSEKRPILKLNSLMSESDKNEQSGFMQIFMGAMMGIRNPKAHDVVPQDDPVHTLQFLALADLLARRVEEATKA